MESSFRSIWSGKKIQFHNSSVKSLNSVSPLKPLIVWMRVLGVELDPFEIESSNLYRYSIFTYGLFLLIGNIILNPLAAINELQKISEIDSPLYFNESKQMNSTLSRQKTTTFTWSVIIDYTSYGMVSIGVHCSLFIVSKQSKWKSLWNNIQQILEGHKEFQSLRKDVRRVVVVGMILAFMVSCNSFHSIECCYHSWINSGNILAIIDATLVW